MTVSARGGPGQRSATLDRAPSPLVTRAQQPALEQVGRRAGCQTHRPPGPDRGGGHRPSGLATEQGGPEPAEVLIGDRRRLPARPFAAQREQRSERREAEAELAAFPPLHGGDPERGEHRLAVGEVPSVDPDVGDGCQSVEVEHPGPRRAGGGREPASEPPVGCVELGRGGLGAARVEIGAGDGPGDPGRHPAEREGVELGRVGCLVGRRARGLPGDAREQVGLSPHSAPRGPPFPRPHCSAIAPRIASTPPSAAERCGRARTGAPSPPRRPRGRRRPPARCRAGPSG